MTTYIYHSWYNPIWSLIVPIEQYITSFDDILEVSLEIRDLANSAFKKKVLGIDSMLMWQPSQIYWYEKYIWNSSAQMLKEKYTSREGLNFFLVFKKLA